MTSATVHLDVTAEEPPKFHCVYNNDSGFSVKVADHDVTVYITGTFAELYLWAGQFIAAVIDGHAALAERNAAQVATDGED